MAPAPAHNAIDSELEAARSLARSGHVTEAERAFDAVLAAHPDCVEALRFLASSAFARSDAARTIALLSRASKSEPRNAQIFYELGLAYRAAERFDAARYVLERAVELGGDAPRARLLLAHVLELDQRPDRALLQYFRALADARRHGHWRNDADIDASLRGLVVHARAYAIEKRNALFSQILGALRTARPDARWNRVEGALANYLGTRPLAPTDTRQNPGFMYTPGIATSFFLDDERFSFPVADLARALAACAGEARACLSAFGHAAPGSGLATAAVFERGVERAALRTCAPAMRAALIAAPLARVLNHGPDCEFVHLPARAQTRQLVGRANSRCRVVVNLTASAPVDVVVFGEARRLAAGEHAIIDPSFAHHFVGASGADVVAQILWFDVWHPDLSADEQHALAALIESAIDFETRVNELP